MKKRAMILPLLILAACGEKRGTTADIPLITPLIVAAMPDSLENFGSMGLFAEPEDVFRMAAIDCAGSTSSRTLLDSLACRLFTDGPANIFNIVDAIDDRIAEINTRTAEGSRPCLANEPVDLSAQYDVPDSTTNFPFYAQCYDVFGEGDGSMLFGKKDGTWYLQEGGTAATSVVKVTPSGGVEGYFLVGVSNSPIDSGTRSIMHFSANSELRTFEFAVAGLNVGFCSSRVGGNASHIFIEGQSSDSAGGATQCAAYAKACANSADLTAASLPSCDSIAGGFNLDMLGRASSAFGDAPVDGAAPTTHLADINTGFGLGVAYGAVDEVTGVTNFDTAE